MADDNNTHSTALMETAIISVKANAEQEQTDVVAVEEPLEIRLGFTHPRKGRVHKSISITMRTPGDDVNLACGFLFSESIITRMEQIVSIDAGGENVIRVELQKDAAFDPARLERHFYTTSSCGVCGKASLEALGTGGHDAIRDNQFSISRKALCELGVKLKERQTLFRQTGGCHATATFNAGGDILSVTEDVGRHNAMDKLIGGLLREDRLPLADTGIIVSGRASFELMQKALVAGCPMLAAVGAPSSLAVELAQEFNITLVGFLGSTGFNIYHSQPGF